MVKERPPAISLFSKMPSMKKIKNRFNVVIKEKLLGPKKLERFAK